jgi:hypothetical protein
MTLHIKSLHHIYKGMLESIQVETLYLLVF